MRRLNEPARRIIPAGPELIGAAKVHPQQSGLEQERAGRKHLGRRRRFDLEVDKMVEIRVTAPEDNPFEPLDTIGDGAAMLRAAEPEPAPSADDPRADSWAE